MQCLRNYLEPARGTFLLTILCIAFLSLSRPCYSDESPPLYQKGLQLYHAGNHAEALAAFREAAEAAPDSADPLYMLGVMHEKGEGVAASEVQASSYYRQSWKKGNEVAHERLTAMYSAAVSGQKLPPPVVPAAAAAVAVAAPVPPAEPSGRQEVVLDIPNETLLSLKGVHFRSSHDDRYRVVVSCPDNCTDLPERAREIASTLGATATGSQGGEPTRYEYISYQTAPIILNSGGEPAAEIPRPVDLTVTCQGWCRITRVVAKSIAQLLVEGPGVARQ